MSEAIQKKLTRPRPPRVKITYDVETGGAIEKRELPFIVGILADLQGEITAEAPARPLEERSFVDIDRHNFDDVLRAVGPGVYLHADRPGQEVLAGSDEPGDSYLRLTSLADFDPLSLVRAVPALRAIYLARTEIRRLQPEIGTNSTVAAQLQTWLEAGTELLELEPRDLDALIDQRVAQIDATLSAALSSIMHMPAFRALEAGWRGLHYLVSRSDTGSMLKLRLLNATKAELLKDFETAGAFDQSMLFKHLCEAGYGTFGDSPCSLVVGDYAIDGSAQDIEFIGKMAEVAAAAHAPFIGAASPELFGLKDFGELASPRDLGTLFSHQALAPWRAFRELEDARYVTLVLPRVLLRLPYGKPEKRNTIPCEGLDFEEQVGATLPLATADASVACYPRPESENFLWGNAAYVLAERITNAFSRYSWTAAIRGVEGGGLVEDLPAYSYASDPGTTELFCPTEVVISDRREKELSELGFMSLCHCKGTAMAAFSGGRTTLSAMLPAMLAASRFALYIKVIMRKRIGSFMTRANVESFLNNWIANYVLLDDNAPQDVKAAYPLRAARVVVTDVPGTPGACEATLFLKPHFQLEELSTSIRLVARLPG